MIYDPTSRYYDFPKQSVFAAPIRRNRIRRALKAAFIALVIISACVLVALVVIIGVGG